MKLRGPPVDPTTAVLRAAEKSFARCERRWGSHDERSLGALHFLARCYREAGDPRAIEYAEKAAVIADKVLADHDYRLGVALSDYAGMLRLVGHLDEAEKLYLRVLTLDEARYPANHPEIAIDLHNLAVLYAGKAARTSGPDREHYMTLSHRHLLRASMINTQHYPPGHPELAADAAAWGAFLSDRGDLDGARHHYMRALEIYEGQQVPNLPCISDVLQKLAGICFRVGQWDEDRRYLELALALDERMLPANSPDVAGTRWMIAVADIAAGRVAEGLESCWNVLTFSDAFDGSVLRAIGECQRMAYLRDRRRMLGVFLSATRAANSAYWDRRAFDRVLRTKQLSLDAGCLERTAVLAGRDRDLRKRLEKLAELRRQVVRFAFDSPGAPQSNACPYHELKSRWSRCETELARQVPELALAERLREVDAAAVSAKLAADATLIEFVRFELRDFKRPNTPIPSHGEHYLAFIASAAGPDELRVIPLGPAQPIDDLIVDFLSLFKQQQGTGRSGVPASDAATAALRSKWLEQGNKLYQALLAPLSPFQPGQWLILAPDGTLGLLPFAVLPTPEGGFLVERHPISYVGCGRDLLRFGTVTSSAGPAAVVVAPDFELRSESTATASSTAESSQPTDSRAVADLTVRRELIAQGHQFTPLPEVQAEGDEVCELLQTTGIAASMWTGSKAVLTRVLSARSPRLLHLATHGFFLERRINHADPASRVGLLDGASATASLGVSGAAVIGVSAPLDDPLLRSGLALAGAQALLDGYELPPKAGTGFLTAQDVTGMDLRGTELVFLSACETGLGDVADCEGILGLRHAFVLAGTRAVVMSLWRIPDRETRHLVSVFYGSSLKGTPKHLALQEAQVSLIRHSQDAGLWPDPFFWGAFICQGDPAPLNVVLGKDAD